MPATFAFLHHVAAFTMVAALAVEMVLLKGELDLTNARKLLRADMVYGLSAAAVLAIGLLRVFYFEKGAGYYFHSVPFLAKIALFAIVGILSIYPTMKLASWRTAVKQGLPPAVDPINLRTIRNIVHWQLVGVTLLIACAALMARGIGYVGA